MVILPGLSVQSVMGSSDAVVQAYNQFVDEYTVYLFDRRKDVPDSYSLADMDYANNPFFISADKNASKTDDFTPMCTKKRS